MPEKIVLRKLMHEVATAQSLETVYDSALRCFEETLGVERAGVVLRGDNGAMRFAACKGLSDAYCRAVESHWPWRPDEPGAAPLLIEDTEERAELEALRSVVARERVRALALVPLCFGSKFLGRFMLHYERPRRFSTNEVTIAETIAGHVAFALEHHHIAALLEARLDAEQEARRSAEREAALREEHERRLHLALAAGAMGSWEWDIAADRVELSAELEPILGVEAGTFGGDLAAFERLIHPEDRESVVETLERAVEGAASFYEVECRIVPPDDAMRWVAVRGRLLRDAQGRPARLVGICSDVSERKRSEQAEAFVAEASRVLARTLEPNAAVEQLARLVVPKLADWCVVFGVGEDGIVPIEIAHRDPVKAGVAREIAEGCPATDSGAVAAAVRRGRSTVTRRVDRRLLSAAARDEEQLRVLESLGFRSAITVPLQVHGRTLGAVMLLTAESERVYGDADLRLATEIASWAALAIDNAALYDQAVTARRDAERAREQLQMLARISNDLATSLDPEEALRRLAEHVVGELADYCITYSCEGSTVRRLGIAHRDPAKRALVEALVETGAPALDDAAGAGAVIRTGEDVLVEEVTDAVLEESTLGPAHLEAVRALEPCSTIIVALRARGATLGAMAMVATTDSNRRYDAGDLELARELAGRAALLIDNARLFARANAAVRDRDDMVAVVSHDLRSPLQSISTAAAMLELDPSDDGRAGNVEAINVAVSQIQWLLTDLADISRIDAGRLAIDTSITDVASLLEEASAVFQPLADGKSIRFDCTIADDVPRVRVDRGRILQVLSNLLGNALKFVSAGGRIELGARREDDGVRIAVTDDGCGIDEQDLPRVFDRFWRGEERGGTGLGLAVARGIVEAHGGVIGVESRKGRGTTFSLVLGANTSVASSVGPPRLGPARASAGQTSDDASKRKRKRAGD